MAGSSSCFLWRRSHWREEVVPFSKGAENTVPRAHLHSQVAFFSRFASTWALHNFLETSLHLLIPCGPCICSEAREGISAWEPPPPWEHQSRTARCGLPRPVVPGCARARMLLPKQLHVVPYRCCRQGAPHEYVQTQSRTSTGTHLSRHSWKTHMHTSRHWSPIL